MKEAEYKGITVQVKDLVKPVPRIRRIISISNGVKRIVAAIVLMALSSGCASYMVVSGRNAELDKKAVQLSATPNGAYAAIDLMGIKGYWQAWKAEPAKMTGATLLDAGTAAIAAWGVSQATKSNSDQPATPSIQNNGGVVIVNTGSGSTSYTTTQTGAAE